MKKIILLCAIIFSSLFVLAFSHLTYQDKLQTIATEANQGNSGEITSNTTAQNNDNGPSVVSTTPDSLIDSWSDQKEEDPVLITFFGSESLTYELNTEASWPNIVTENLQQYLSPALLETTIIDAGADSSLEVLESDVLDDVIASQPDILVFEPFMLNNNGELLINDSLESLENMLSIIESELENTDIIIIPPNPLYKAVNYPTQVEELQQYVEENGYTYVNHWVAWPESEDEVLQEYLEDGLPNEEGHQLWATYMTDFLTSEQE
ncbi:SGNH/GDSL hydrolase family protein [Alkalihalophilus lindianensis]|uniref:SGNH/GDSL hydrolase family protein n=1 Tax=Alkalihalophilus lindianensis TaxID=1630542 RepID=A0ABU3X8X1_9BACI|nr:SGNH/GDSL hydrolase family protein [Alkalihalophilus lindianensis]MDV2684340.1 SGNH/GDSL hydrolase family protein [Alkalihalophilus lindianensis]